MTLLSQIDELLELPPFGASRDEKESLLLPRLRGLTRHHAERCPEYARILDGVFGYDDARCSRLADVPFVPVSLFKTRSLKSVDHGEVFKVLTSSGTTGQAVSRIHLDRTTAQLQSKALAKLVQEFLGRHRLPMVIIDHPHVVRDRQSFSARGAGILGLAQFGRQPFYALREDMSLDWPGLASYLETHRDQPVVLFGFTFMVWQHFVQELEREGRRLSLSQATLIHSGGWKKVQSLAVTPEVFRARLREVAGIERVLNFYGMVEQVGSVFFENEWHRLHAPLIADIIIRDPATLAPLPLGQPGLVQVLSVLPFSYPGHSLLTEDLGVIHGFDAPGQPRKGCYFEILGRVPQSELRGCSDTFSRT